MYVCKSKGLAHRKASACTRLPVLLCLLLNLNPLAPFTQGAHPFWLRSEAPQRCTMACTAAPPRREHQPYDLAASMRAQLLQWRCLRQLPQALRSPEHGCIGAARCNRALPCSAPLPAKRHKPEPAPLDAPARGGAPPPAAVRLSTAQAGGNPALSGRALGSPGRGAAGAPLRGHVLDPDGASAGPGALAAGVLAHVLHGRMLATSAGALASAPMQSDAQGAWQPARTWSPGRTGPAPAQGKPVRTGGGKPSLASGPQRPRLPPRAPPRRRGGLPPLLDARGTLEGAAAAQRGVQGAGALGEPAGLGSRLASGRCAAAAVKVRAGKPPALGLRFA